MLVYAFGVNHRAAPVALREALAKAKPAVLALAGEWRQRCPGAETVLLNTCNRFELYLAMERERALAEEAAIAELTDALGEAGPEARRCLYIHEGVGAARHLFRVAGSLDSQILGEDQIQGQVKQAFAEATEAATTGPVLNHLFHHALRAGKRVRTETEVSRSPVSVAGSAMVLAKRVFGDMAGCRVLIVGGGEMATRCLEHLKEHRLGRVVVANRTLSRAAALAEEFGAEAALLDEVPTRLAAADLVVAATGAEKPVVEAAAVAAAMKGRGPMPMLLLDLAVPRNIDPGVDAIAQAYLYNLDDLEGIASENRDLRAKAAEAAERMVAEEAQAFGSWLESRRAAPVIEELVRRSRQLAEAELEKALGRVTGLAPEAREACARAIRGALAKVLHQPLVALRALPSGSDGERTLEVVRELFQLGKDGGAMDQGDGTESETGADAAPRVAGAREVRR